jgi:hypothetical protein
MLVGVALLLAGCGSGGPGVANLGAGATPTASPGSPNTQASLEAFSQCMRKHGITNFPDPGSGGTLTISGGPGSGLDPRSATFQAAQKACRSLLPNGGQPSAQQQQQFQQAALKFSQCMRAHGIANFPDPVFNGAQVGLQLPQGIDAKSPQFQAAQKTCQSLLPKPPGGGATSGGPGGGSSGSGPVTQVGGA